MTTEERSYDLSDLEEWDELSLEDKIEALKGTVTVPEVAQLAGLEVDEGDKIPSPWNPDERTPSCHLYDDHFYDYSTGKFGDIFDLVIALNGGEVKLGQAVRMIHRRAVSVGKEYGDVETSQPRVLQDFTNDLPEAPLADDELFISLGFGCRIDDQGNVLVPHTDENGTYGVKVRWASGGKGSWAGSQFTHRLYDPFGWGRGQTTHLVLCEGESDAWAMIYAIGTCADVLAMPAGAKNWRDHWLEDLEPYERVLVCMDNDKTGREARDKLMRKIGWGRTEELRVPQLYGDAREAIVAGWRPTLD